tara:strand:- start:244 stop:579 length:336 start_codon:yes stop_codon:yes gene_type:complete
MKEKRRDQPVIKIEKNIDISANCFGGMYATASREMEKGDSCLFKVKVEARMLEQALRMTYRQRKYGFVRRGENQSVKGITKLRRQKDDDGNIIGYRVWLMVDMPEDNRECG